MAIQRLVGKVTEAGSVKIEGLDLEPGIEVTFVLFGGEETDAAVEHQLRLASLKTGLMAIGAFRKVNPAPL